MKTLSPNLNVKTKVLKGLLMFLTCLPLWVSAGSITFNVLQQPCNSDGQLEFTVTGVNMPCNVNIYFTGTGTTQNYTLNTSTDIIQNYSGEEIYVYANDGTNTAWNSFSAPPFTYSVNTTPAICPSLTGTATVSISGGQAPYNFDWVEDANPSLIVATGSPANLSPGFYAVTITDANGCIFSSNMGGDSIYIYNQSGMNINVTNTPANCSNGTATINTITGGTAPYSYLWNNGSTSTSISGLVSNQYFVEVTDANGCNEIGYTYVQQSVTINANPVTSDATCLQTDGSVISFGSGGLSPYTYQYSNNANTQSVTGLAAGNYSVIVTDANGCIGTGWFTINASTPITVNYSVTPSSCTIANGGSTLNINGGTSPYSVNWNTFPSQNGTSLAGVTAGSYFFTVIDNVGCVQTGTVQVPFLNPIYGNISHSNTMCNTSNGVASINASGGTPPLTYLWSTSATTSSISGLPTGGYSCTVSDVVGCSLTKSTSVQSISPIGIGFNTTHATCIYNADGAITASAFGGQAPYSFYWSNGSTATTISGLAPGNYYLNVVDANGCSKNSSVAVSYDASNNSCYCTIEGTVFNDINGDCIQDNGEDGIHNVMIECAGFGYAFTNTNGNYSFHVPTGTYTISQIVQSIYPLAACQNNSNVVSVTAASNCTTSVNFANTITPLHDIHVFNTAYTPPIPGNMFSQYTIVSNNGTVTENNTQLSYKHDGQLGLLGSTIPYTQLDATNEPNWYSVQTGFPVLNPGDATTIINSLMTPTNIPLGTMINFRDTVCYQNPISDWVNDYTPWNNIHTFQPQVMGSFDPNFKEVSPRGDGAEGFINRNEEHLNYIVHFQNTGTWAAQLVVIRDTLDADLDWETLQPGWSDHTYTTSIDNNGVLTFRFENINLPDSASNPIGSMGMVSYSIKVKPNLPALTEITNTAGIYFDFNAPVITNTTLNTITDSLLGTEEISKIEINAMIYPNPTHDVSTLMIYTNEFEENVSVLLTDITGKLISEKTISLSSGENHIPIQNGNLENGMYFVTIISGEKNKTLRLVKQ